MSVDSGLFGPTSVTWHLHADPAMWIGGISALHLQALHPLAAMGIVQNSSFEEDPFGRLVSTGSFIVQTTWGTRAEAELAGSRLRAVHAGMRIHEAGTGKIHRLDSPDLLLWVHCALTRSNLHAVRRGGLKITPEQADHYVHEQRSIAALVGLDPTDTPGTAADLDDYLTGMYGALAASEEAMVIHRFLSSPPLQGLHRALRPAWSAASRLGYSIIPPEAQALYQRPGIPAPMATVALRAARSAALLVPQQRRLSFPAPHLSRAIARLGQAGVPSGKRLRSLSWSAAPTSQVHGADRK